MEDPADPVALVVDVDGTLIRSDLLAESACALLGKSPGKALLIPLWLMRGRANLKRQIARLVDLDVRLLPYNDAVLERVRRARKSGRPVYLASASDEKYVAAIAGHLALFDGWYASDGEANLSGPTKATRLVEAFGERGFDYIGDAMSDLAVWEHARTALTAARSRRVEKRLATLKTPIEPIAATRATPKTWLRLLRPHQWAKNILVGVALVTAHVFSAKALLDDLLAFTAFSICASSVYILNDLIDVRADRDHPTKRLRPFASGELSLVSGALLAPFLLGGSVLFALSVSYAFAGVLAAYYVGTLAYTFVLKRKMLIDVVALAGLYTIRVIGGAVAIGVLVSPWILGFSMFMFVALALVKRYSELASRLDAGLADPANRNYKTSDLSVLMSLAAAAGYSAVIVFSLYIASDAVTSLYERPEILWLAVPLLIYWISRLLVMTNRRLVHEDPVIFALKDRISLMTGALVLALVVLATLVPPPSPPRTRPPHGPLPQGGLSSVTAAADNIEA